MESRHACTGTWFGLSGGSLRLLLQLKLFQLGRFLLPDVSAQCLVPWRHQTTERTFADVCFHAIVFKEARDIETEKEASESRGRDFHVPIHHHTQTFMHTCGVQ